MRRMSKSEKEEEKEDDIYIGIDSVKDRLMNNKPIVYRLKYEGSFLVSESRGVTPVRTAFKELKRTKEERRKRGIRHTPIKEFVITTAGISIRDPISKEEELSYGIRSISYIVNDEKNRNYIGMIAQLKGKGQFECTILKHDEGRGRDVVHALGTAFDYAYEKNIESSANKRKSESEKAENSVKGGTEVVDSSAAPVLSREASVDEITILKSRLKDLAVLVPEEKLSAYLKKQNITEITEIPKLQTANSTNASTNSDAKRVSPTVGRKLENLIWDDASDASVSAPNSRKASLQQGELLLMESDVKLQRKISEPGFPRVNPPPKSRPRSRTNPRPQSTLSIDDPFEMGDFNGVSFPEFEEFEALRFESNGGAAQINSNVDLLA